MIRSMEVRGWTRTLVILCLAVGVTLLIVRHWVHAVGVLPYLFLLACPLIHLFGHRGHGGHAHGRGMSDG